MISDVIVAPFSAIALKGRLVTALARVRTSSSSTADG